MSVDGPALEFRIVPEDRTPVQIPGDRYSIRQNSAIWFQDRYNLYADVVPWDYRFHPDTYDTSIRLFESADAENWEYRCAVIGKGRRGEWTANGVATPGAALSR